MVALERARPVLLAAVGRDWIMVALREQLPGGHTARALPTDAAAVREGTRPVNDVLGTLWHGRRRAMTGAREGSASRLSTRALSTTAPQVRMPCRRSRRNTAVSRSPTAGNSTATAPHTRTPMNPFPALPLARLADAGADEAGCLVDFGLPAGDVLAGLPRLAELLPADRPTTADADRSQ
ncbi:hypothetical protein AB0L10_43575 [Streptomyces flaveolus]|uniref:hypothetical protein n=1 Tax=Streptomyces flaveolus TaxID=67297 RepID=UPI00341A433D